MIRNTADFRRWGREVRVMIAADIHKAIMGHEVYCVSIDDLIPTEDFERVVKLLQEARDSLPKGTDTRHVVETVVLAMINALSDGNM